MVRYAPELIAAVRRRYEETDQPMPAIAVECGMSLRALHRMVEREGWSKRSDRPPRTLPPAARLLEEAHALAEEKAPAAADEDTNQDADQDADQETNSSLSAVERIEALVMKEIAAEEAARAVLRGRPRGRGEARDVARNLSTLTQTLQTLRRMGAGEKKTDGPCADCPYYDDDMPEDIDARREALARRIEAFFESRKDDPGAFGEEGGETGVGEDD